MDDDIRNSINIYKGPERIIKQGTGHQFGKVFETIIKSIYGSNDVQFSNVKIIPYLYTQRTNNKEKISCTFSDNTSKNNIWHIEKMQWSSKALKRSPRNSVNEKHVILFDFCADYITLSKYQGRVTKELCSDVIVIVTHSNQEPIGMVTLFWYDNFKCDDTVDAYVKSCRDPVQHEELIIGLSNYFKNELDQELSYSSRVYLSNKLKMVHERTGDPPNMISFDHFLKIPLITSKKHSLGQWIMLNKKMIRKNQKLFEMWKAGLIYGFCDKELCQNDLAPFRFLLRFSETRPASLGVVTMSEVGEPKHWKPYNDVELQSHPLADRLLEFAELRHIVCSQDRLLDKTDALAKFSSVHLDDGYTRRGDVGNPLENLYITDGSSMTPESLITETSPVGQSRDVLLTDHNCYARINEDVDITGPMWSMDSSI